MEGLVPRWSKLDASMLHGRKDAGCIHVAGGVKEMVNENSVAPNSGDADEEHEHEADDSAAVDGT